MRILEHLQECFQVTHGLPFPASGKQQCISVSRRRLRRCRADIERMLQHPSLATQSFVRPAFELKKYRQQNSPQTHCSGFFPGPDLRRSDIKDRFTQALRQETELHVESRIIYGDKAGTIRRFQRLYQASKNTPQLKVMGQDIAKPRYRKALEIGNGLHPRRTHPSAARTASRIAAGDCRTDERFSQDIAGILPGAKQYVLHQRRGFPETQSFSTPISLLSQFINSWLYSSLYLRKTTPCS